MITPKTAKSNSPQALDRRVQMFSGGGFRFGYYLGSYACLYDEGLQPDVIIASCGGSLSALLVDIAPSSKDLYQLSQSRELYQALSAVQAKAAPTNSPPTNTIATEAALIKVKNSLKRSKSRSRPHYFSNAYHRWRMANNPSKLKALHQQQSYQQLLAELNQLAMFEIDEEQNWLTELLKLKDSSQPTPKIAIVASRLSPSSEFGSCVRLEEVLFADPALNDSLQSACEQDAYCCIKCPVYPYAPHRLVPNIKLAALTLHNMPLAVRASMADMYYLNPIALPGLGWCLGGVIDLTPIELACKLGTTVFAETKAQYDPKLAVPAIKKVFGFDPNSRLKALPDKTHKPQFDYATELHWLPFADNGKMLRGQHITKRINFFQRNVSLQHPSYDRFVSHMQAQWQFGYQRTLQYIKQHMKG